MKKMMMPLAALLTLAACATAQTNKNEYSVNVTTSDVKNGVLQFTSLAYDFGTISEGPKANHEFQYTNTGNSPVTIASAKAGCGCTVASWKHEPVMPGESGSISVSFNTEHRPGAFTKQVVVTSDGSEPTITLTIRGTVSAPGTVADSK